MLYWLGFSLDDAVTTSWKSNNSVGMVLLDVDSDFYIGGHSRLHQVYGRAMKGAITGFTGILCVTSDHNQLCWFHNDIFSTVSLN